jgi:hypothetical protein
VGIHEHIDIEQDHVWPSAQPVDARGLIHQFL